MCEACPACAISSDFPPPWFLVVCSEPRHSQQPLTHRTGTLGKGNGKFRLEVGLRNMCWILRTLTRQEWLINSPINTCPPELRRGQISLGGDFDKSSFLNVNSIPSNIHYWVFRICSFDLVLLIWFSGVFILLFNLGWIFMSTTKYEFFNNPFSLSAPFHSGSFLFYGFTIPVVITIVPISQRSCVVWGGESYKAPRTVPCI